VTEPDSDLRKAMLARAADLARYMADRGIPIESVNGRTAAGDDVTVIIAVGENAERVAEAGERMAQAAEDALDRAADRARKN
jgi:hypothetical protein